MRKVWTSALVGVVIMAVATGGDRASASSDRAFTGYSDATVVSIEYGVPDWIVHRDRFVEHGGPTSAAFLESGGRAGSSASFPDIGYQADYPGIIDTVMTGSGVQEPPTFPPYPMKASANDPGNPSQVVGDPNGPYFLTASATLEASRGQARLGAADKESEASNVTSEVTQTDHQVTAVAYSVARGIVLGPLSVDVVRSKSTTTYKRGDDQPVSTSELMMQGGKVGDLSFSFGPAGLQVAQSGVPLRPSDGLGKLNDALAPSGLQVHFTDPKPTNGGVAAAAFEVDGKHPVPLVAGEGKEGLFRVRLGGAGSGVSLGQELSDGLEAGSSSSADTAPADPGAPASPASLAPSEATTVPTSRMPAAEASPYSAEDVVFRLAAQGAGGLGTFEGDSGRSPAAGGGEAGALAEPGTSGIASYGSAPPAAILPAASRASTGGAVAGGLRGLTLAAAICLGLGLFGVGIVVTTTVKKGLSS